MARVAPLKNFSVGRMMSGAASSFASEMGKAAADEAKRGVQGKVREGIRGIFKK